MVTNIVTAIVLMLYLALAWLAGSYIGESGSRVWVLRVGLSLIGFVAAAIFLWFDRRLKIDRLMQGPNAPFFSELDALLNHAANRLRQRTGRSLASFPIVYVTGESNTAKTSILEHCGAQPELLAGEPERDGQIAATPAVNIWLAGTTLLIEAGGRLANDPALWQFLLERTQPNPVLASLASIKKLPSRAIVVCIDCERLAGVVEEIASSAKRSRDRLHEAAATLGASMPVYVLFTKMDRVAHFAEFVSNMSQEENSQALGATLSPAQIGGALVAEGVGGNISQALDQVIYSLADKRLEYLERETAAEKLSSIYEFPRELRKLRNPIVQFLVELSRPAQAGASCFLRGFYFSGVRAVVVSEMVQAPKVTAAAAASVAAATRMFTMEDLQALSEPPSGPVIQSRKVPVWTFLPSLFSDVILQDRAALDVSRHSRNVERARAALLGFAAAFLIIAAGLLAASFLWNQALEQEVLSGLQSLRSAPELAEGQLATLEQLRNLENVRASLAQLEHYQESGLDLRHRLGLYVGGEIYPDARQIYFQEFNKLLLHPVQLAMLHRLDQLPATARPSDEFGSVYKTLKTYLLTTTESDKSTPDFLAPALLEQWTGGQQIDDGRVILAKKQFEFYAAQLATSHPLPTEADAASVGRARRYLSQFNGMESIYQSMLAEAARNNSDLDFNRQYPGSGKVVSESHVVPAAFTRSAFVVMQDAMSNPDKFYGAEQWVLGQSSAVNIPKEQMQAQVRTRYGDEYLNQWRSFLRSANVAHYGNAKDAADKLRVLSGNRSPLMQLFWVAAVNTNVDLPGSTKSFDAVQRVAGGATADNPIGPDAQSYMTALNRLQGSISALAAAPETFDRSELLNSALVATGRARSSVGQVAQAFVIDGEGHIDSQVRKLMEDPVVSAESLVRRLVQQQAEKQKQSAQNR
jgi:type VI secretion system protein ImpL